MSAASYKKSKKKKKIQMRTYDHGGIEIRKIPLFHLSAKRKIIENTQLQNPVSYVLKCEKIDISGQMTVAALNWYKIKIIAFLGYQDKCVGPY